MGHFVQQLLVAISLGALCSLNYPLLLLRLQFCLMIRTIMWT